MRFQVNDSEGLHQMILRGLGGLIACRELAGETDALVEFNYDGADTLQGLTLLPDAPTHQFFVEAVATDGNLSAHMPFSLTENSPHRIAILEGHTAWLHSVSFSPDGSTLASGGVDRTVKLWDVATQQDIATLPHGARVTSVAFSADGMLLASGAVDGTVTIWDVTMRQDVSTLLHGDQVTSVAFSRDGAPLASGSRDGTVKLWDVTTQQDIGTLPHEAGITSVAFSRDGMLLASGGQDKTVKLWDVTTQQDIGSLEGHRIRVYSVSFSPVQRTLASTGGITVMLWDVTTQQNVGILRHGSDIGSVAFSRDGRTLASGGWDGTVKLWDVASGANFATFGNMSGVNSVSFSSDGVTLASGTQEGMIELWDTSGWMQERLEAVAEIDIPDLNLRASIAAALGKPLSAPIVQGNVTALTHLIVVDAGINSLTGLEGLTKLTELRLPTNNISDISSLAELTNLSVLSLWVNNVSAISSMAELTKLTLLELGRNNISEISPLAGLTNLQWLGLSFNNISDLSPLVANTGLGEGNDVELHGNPLSYASIYVHIPALQERGVEVSFDNRTPRRINIVSGDGQESLPGAALVQPFVVEVRDERGVAFEGVPVTFTVTAGDGTLSITSTATDNDGRTESILTLGPHPGVNTVEVAVTGIQETQTVTAIAVPPPIPEDVNGDDVVNILDLVSVAVNLGNEGTDLAADVNGDGVVNILDLVRVAGALGDAAAAPSAWYRDLEIAPTRADVVRWLAQLGELDLTDATSQQGVLFLQQLLAALTPNATALLPNYPNPFNPETWIPYQLAEDANVTLTIYDSNGIVVRQLDLGHQSAGYYADRGNPAYWDGRNGYGEQVASGVYFYRLSAAEYSATRKMLIRK